MTMMIYCDVCEEFTKHKNIGGGKFECIKCKNQAGGKNYVEELRKSGFAGMVTRKGKKAHSR